MKFSILHNILIAELSMFDIKIAYSSCDSKFPLEFSTIRNYISPIDLTALV